MILIDTNILVYAIGDPHPLQSPCRRLLDAHGSGRLELATTLDVLQEFTSVRAKRRPRERAVDYTRAFAASLLLAGTSLDDLDHGLDLFVAHAGLSAIDAVLAAVAIDREAEALVSADRRFAGIPGLRHIDPATPAMDTLLAKRN